MTALCALAVLLALVPAAAAAAGISGQVSDTTAHPLEGIEVCAEPITPLASTVCARTDAAGEYSLPSAGPGYLVHFYALGNGAPGYAQQWYPGKQFSEEAEAVTESEIAGGIDAQLAIGGTVGGRVTSRIGSAPIEGVEICPDPVVFRNLAVSHCTRTDANGEYVLRGLSAGETRFELGTSGNVNYVEELSPPLSVHVGSTLVLEVQLVPGVKVAGTVTEAGTGIPVTGLGAPYSTPSVCALGSETEARIKCTVVGPGGHYSLPGLPPGEIFGVVFARDGVEEGLDLHPDGYVRQYWDQVPAWNEAALIAGSGGSTFGSVNAVLSRGEEVFPRCEVASACVAPSDDSAPGLTPPARSSVSGVTATTGPAPVFQAAIRCPKGFLKVERIAHTRCVKIKKKKHPQDRRRHRRHRRHRASRRNP